MASPLSKCYKQPQAYSQALATIKKKKTFLLEIRISLNEILGLHWAQKIIN